MKTNKVLLFLVLFASLMLLAGPAMASNLTLSKTVKGDSTYLSGENITWILTVTNHNNTPENDIKVTDTIPSGCLIKGFLPKNGTVKDSIWTLNLTPGAKGILEINMSCTQACGSRDVENTASIISPAPARDTVPSDNNATRTVRITAPSCTASNLSLKKEVIGRSSYNLSEKIVWRITVTNHNTSTRMPVLVTEQAPSGCTVLGYDASRGSVTNNVWSVDLAPSESENLVVNISCSKVCGIQTVTNTARITSPDPAVDLHPSDNIATSSVSIRAPACVGMTVRPITLNLKSKGVLTVFFTLGGQVTSVESEDEGEDDENEEDSPAGIRIEKGTSSLSCNGADASKILFSMKNGGTVIGKFPRQSLDLEVDNGTAFLTCEGTVYLTNGSSVHIQGNQTLRVIHAEAVQKQSLFQRILAFLGLASPDTESDEDTPAAIPPSVNLDEVKNFGQLKKILKNLPEEEQNEEEETPVTPVKNQGKDKPDSPGKGDDKKNHGQEQNHGKGNSK